MLKTSSLKNSADGIVCAEVFWDQVSQGLKRRRTCERTHIHIRSSVCRLFRRLSKFGIESEAKEDQDGPKPLHMTDNVPEQQNRAQDGEELARGGDDGTGERPKIHHSHEDERLSKSTSDAKQEDIIDDAGIAVSKSQKLPHLTRPQHSYS